MNFWARPFAEADYFPERCHYDFRWWYETSGGRMTDWGAHHLDIVQWALGMDDSGPLHITGAGAAPLAQPNCFTCHPSFEVTYTYGNGPEGSIGTRVICRNGPPANWTIRETVRGTEKPADNGILFEGENNQWLWVSRDSIQASDRRLLDAPLSQDAVRLPHAESHMANFLDSVRTRETPLCPAAVGQSLGNRVVISASSRCVFSAVRRSIGTRVQNASSASTPRPPIVIWSRPMRAPWRLDV